MSDLVFGWFVRAGVTLEVCNNEGLINLHNNNKVKSPFMICLRN